MPTTIVSFLGTGQKVASQSARSEYRKTVYEFHSPDGEPYQQETSLFGTALVRFLRKLDTDIDRWIVLGTSASLWSELNQILADPDGVSREYYDIDELVIRKQVDEAALRKWEQTLNAEAAPLQLCLRLTGDALSRESQQRIAQALFENIPRRNDVVFDISHGYRHQPVIAGFIISLMRWTHAIGKVSFYSGVFEARQGNVTPVIELSICQELLDATDATAILGTTGNYESVARCLNMDAELAWFLENTNQLGNARTAAQQLLSQSAGSADVVGAQLSTLLRERLEWSREARFADRVRESARAALERGDYFRAVVLGYEAIIICAGQLLYPKPDPLNYQTRKDAEQALYDQLNGHDRELLHDLRHTRNACAHGTRSDRANPQKILQNPRNFQDLIRQAFDLFDRLKQLLPP
ncbi:TIGR02221 family CRISPR-associated protein [Thermopirellula anaerolimosa]